MGDTSQSSLMGNNNSNSGGKELKMERPDIRLKLPQVKKRNKSPGEDALKVMLSG